MDDHLFLNLRTVCSRLVTVGEMKISYFLHSPPPSAPLLSRCTLTGVCRGRRNVRGKERKKNPKKTRASRRAGAQTCDHIWHFSPSVTNDGVFST